MFRNQLVPPLLAALVSVPGFLIGQQLRHGNQNVLLMVPVLAIIVLVASLLMRQSD
jgi:putative effector of murein hydrolase